MKFRLTHPAEIQPEDKLYYKVMRPLWRKLKPKMATLVDVRWTPKETPGPLLLSLTANISDKRINCIEIRGEAVEGDMTRTRHNHYIVELSQWQAFAHFAEDFHPPLPPEFAQARGFAAGPAASPRQAITLLRTKCKEELGISF